MGLWGVVERHPPEFFGLPAPPETLLRGEWFEWFALLYRRCAVNFGWTPVQVDDMELWVVASSLGEATKDLEEWHTEYSRLEREYEQSDTPEGLTPNVKYGQDILAQRVAASKGEGPPPEVRPMSPLETANLTRHLRGN